MIVRLLCVATTAVVLAAASSPLFAREPDAEGVDRVEVTGIKDPAIIAYKRAYELGTRVREAGHGRVELQVRLTSTTDDRPIPGLTVHVVGDTVDVAAPVSTAGFLAIPLDERAYREGADFIVNQRKGAIRMRVFLLQKLPEGPLTYDDVTETVRLARAARADVLPWYLRIITPTINGVGLCFDTAGRAVTIEGADVPRRDANSEETDDAGVKVWCANFKPGEKTVPPDARLVADQTFRPIFLESAL